MSGVHLVLQETDFATVQNSLKAPVRSGIGKTLQDRCGESSPELSKWIDALERPKRCGQGSQLDDGALQRSARFQCGAW